MKDTFFWVGLRRRGGPTRSISGKQDRSEPSLCHNGERQPKRNSTAMFRSICSHILLTVSMMMMIINSSLAFSPMARPSAVGTTTRQRTMSPSSSSLSALPDDKAENPNRRKALAALIVWPLLAVGDDIYVSQIQPRLAEQGVETPNLPYVEPKPYGYEDS